MTDKYLRRSPDDLPTSPEVYQEALNHWETPMTGAEWLKLIGTYAFIFNICFFILIFSL